MSGHTAGETAVWRSTPRTLALRGISTAAGRTNHRSGNGLRAVFSHDFDRAVYAFLHPILSGRFPCAVFIFREEHEQQRTLAGRRLDGHAHLLSRSKIAIMANCAGRLKIRESDRCRADRQDVAFHENAHPALEPVSPCDQLAEPPHSRT